MADHPNVSPSSISLPKGGGAIQGIGETFQADEFTGAAALSIPIPTSPCRDVEPHLSVDYSSGAGNGCFGLGFGLAIPNVSRKTATGLPRYDDTDTFLLSNAEDLVPIDGSERSEPPGNPRYRVVAYRPRLEGLFARIEHWTDQQTGDSYWRVVSTENVTSLFGTTADTRIADPTAPRHVLQWLLAETFDARGNQIVYGYKAENSDNLPAALSEVNRVQTANKYVQRIAYGNATPFQEGQVGPTQWYFEAVFDYGEYSLDPSNPTPYTPVQTWASRPDPFSSYHGGFEIRTHRLCRHILMFHRFAELGAEPVLVHATRFHYQESPVVTLLQSVESIGYRFENGSYQTRSMPALEFKYTAFQPEEQTFEPLMEENDRLLPGLSLSPDYQLIDVYGEGIPGILYSDGRTVFYGEPSGAGNGQGTKIVRYAWPQPLPTLPIESQRQTITHRLIDVTGDGKLELLVSTPAGAGYYEANPDHAWANFRTFPAFPNDFYNPNNYLVDVTGDGLADIVLLEDGQVRVYPSQGADGFGASLVQVWESSAPMPRQGAINEVVLFADLFGSGTQHLARITNGKVECWPNLGYGRFGKPMLLDNAPRFGAELDAERLFLADLDGSGTSDLIYLYPDRAEVFFNRSGNSFSEPLKIPLPSAWDKLDQITFADVHGSGTTCLIFSENLPQPRHWCYDFSAQRKPYLLNEIDNNMGAQSTLAYSSSVKFYLADKQQGRPWIVSLPFPVQVVERTETFDLISQTRLVSAYTYHHGYYDGIEREFRGFGLVERQEAETLSVDSQPADAPPVVTKTWYHTGAWLQDRPLSRQYAQEYFQGDRQAHQLPDSVFDNPNGGSDPDAWRGAFRSLKGAILREEVYAPTAPAGQGQDQAAPYTVTETNYCVRLLQPKGRNVYGIYHVHPQESLSYEYERNPADPRVDHSFVLKVDQYGNILRSCTVTYGRRPAARDLLPDQLSLKVVAKRDRFINLPRNTPADAVHVLGVPQEHQTYEIKTLSLPPGQIYFSFADIQAYFESLAGALTPGIDSPAYQLLMWTRHYYWDPDQGQAGPPGYVSPQVLLCQTEEAVFTDAQIKTAFDRENAQGTLQKRLETDGGYRLDETYWWSAGPAEAYCGAQQFYFPKATTDPLSAQTGRRVEYGYDPYNLILVAVTVKGNDVLDTVTQAAIDYQALQLRQLADINGNISEARFDPLGMVIVASHYGMEAGRRAGFMPLDQYQLLDPTDAGQVIANPQTFLQGAANYFYYDLLAWKDRRVPVSAVDLIATRYPMSDRPSVSEADFAGLKADPADLWADLAANGYISAAGAILDPFWELKDAAAMRLSPDFSPLRSELLNILSAAVQIQAAYHDGFGRTHQLLMKVESGPALVVDPGGGVVTQPTDDRWLTSGRVVYNNKGQPVKHYEPYYSAGYRYIDNQRLAQFGVSPTLFYDPPGRLAATLHPDHTYEKVVFDPWRRTSWDANDTVTLDPRQDPDVGHFFALLPETDYLPTWHTRYTNGTKAQRDAAAKATAHANTPSIAHMDNLGRVVHDARQKEDGSPLTTVYEWNIQGYLLSSADPRLAPAGQQNISTTYTMTGLALKSISVDAGARWQLMNVLGNVIYTRDSRGFESTLYYDALQRPREVHIAGGDGATPLADQLVERTVYGDSLDAQGHPVVDHPEAHNLRGQIYRHDDQAGSWQNSEYSIQGLPLQTQCQLRGDHKQVFCRSLQIPLEPPIYTTHNQYDALGRPIAQTDPDGNLHQFSYLRSGELNQALVRPAGAPTPDVYVESIAYNPRGQRQVIAYGNGVTTTYTYDPETFRLSGMQTRRGDGKLLQDLAYTCDPMGNITQIADSAWETIFNNNQRIDPVSSYTYDALYRLIQATGREHPGLTRQNLQQGDFAGAWAPQPLNNAQALANYAQRYAYDDGGNLFNVRHQGAAPYACELVGSAGSNRAIERELFESKFAAPTPLPSGQLVAPESQVSCFFDRNGNQMMLAGPTQPIAWNCRDQIGSVTTIARASDNDDAEYYIYNSAGQRVRKVKQWYGNGGAVVHREETIYLGALEIHRTWLGETVTEERRSLRVMDDERCVAIRQEWKQGQPPAGVKNPQLRYQLDNHLGSAVMEADQQGRLISYEEYFPYGGTALASGRSLSEVQLKQYRYSGKERDATGLYYYGARYYAPWLGRWMNPDPAGTVDGLNVFAFVGGNPVNYDDKHGKAKRKAHHVFEISNAQGLGDACANKRRRLYARNPPGVPGDYIPMATEIMSTADRHDRSDTPFENHQVIDAFHGRGINASMNYLVPPGSVVMRGLLPPTDILNHFKTIGFIASSVTTIAGIHGSKSRTSSHRNPVQMPGTPGIFQYGIHSRSGGSKSALRALVAQAYALRDLNPTIPMHLSGDLNQTATDVHNLIQSIELALPTRAGMLRVVAPPNNTHINRSTRKMRRLDFTITNIHPDDITVTADQPGGRGGASDHGTLRVTLAEKPRVGGPPWPGPSPEP